MLKKEMECACLFVFFKEFETPKILDIKTNSDIAS